MNFWKGSLMARLVSYFLLLSLVMVALAGALAFVGGREALKQSVADRLQVFATLEKDQLYRWVDHQREDVELLAASPEVRALSEALLQADTAGVTAPTAYTRLQDYLKAALVIKPDLKELFILSDAVGRIALSTDTSHEGASRIRDSFFTEGRKRTYVQNVYPSPPTFEPTLTISTPLRNPAGQPVGVLAAHLNLDEVDRIIQGRAGLGLSGETYLVDKYNVFISGERFGRERFPRGVYTQGINAALNGIDGWGLYPNYEDVPVIGVYSWIESLELALLVEVAQAEAFAPAQRIAWFILVVGLGLAFALAVGTVLLARQIARPILDITETALRIADGDLTANAPVETQDEVGVLARTFNDMTARLRLLYDDLTQEIRERKQAEAVREHLIDELEVKNAELERFTYTVSHELKSPLVTIKGFLGLLEQDIAGGDTRRIQGDITQIKAAADKMARLLSELLELSRIGRQINPPEAVSLTDVAREAAALVAGSIRQGRIDIDINAAMPAVYGDRVRLLEVYQNLIENAVKFMGDQATPRIVVGAQPAGDEVVCFVQDNGIGIAPKYHDKIFGLFDRLNHEAEGTGIGLALVRRIVDMHGGRIWVESEGTDRGCTFRFTLPIKKADAATSVDLQVHTS